MKAMPMICPQCGELLIVPCSPTGRLFVPAHDDLIQPGTTCSFRNAPYPSRAQMIEAWLDRQK